MRYSLAGLKFCSMLLLLWTADDLPGQEPIQKLALKASSLQVNETDFRRKIAVQSGFGTGWKAVVDRQRGGVVTELRIPADGSNLLTDEGGRFGGMCSVLYVDRKETGEAESGYVAKGALYGFGRVERMEVVEQGEDKVVVEVRGRGGNQVPPERDVVAYTQRYTFRPDRIEFAGELDWLFDDVVPDSRLELLQFGVGFARDAAVGEMRILDSDTMPAALVETNSKGRNLPEGIDYPITVEVPLRANEYKSLLRIRSLELPPQMLEARFYCNEYPRQIDGQRGFAFKAWEGYPGNGNIRFSNSEPIRYRYEVEIVPDIYKARKASTTTGAAP